MRYCVELPEMREGELVERIWFDEPRLELVTEKYTPAEKIKAESKKSGPGGPQNDPSSRRHQA